MRRRDFVKLAGGAAICPLAVHAQQGTRQPRIGVLLGAYSQADPAGQQRLDAFRKTLQGLGSEDGRNLQIDYRFGAGSAEANGRLTEQMVQSAPDAIIATSDPIVAHLHKLTTTIPVIFTQTSEPVNSGIVASLARPGGNMTGFQNFEPAIGSKWLQVIKEAAPDLKGAGALFNPDAAAHLEFLKSAQGVASGLGMTLTLIDIQADLEDRIASYAKEPSRGLLVFPHPITIANRRLISALAIRHKIPAIYPYRYIVDDGGLISYGPNQLDQWRGAANYLSRILKGEKPGDLPVQTPTTYELVVNLKTAKAIGLTVPPTLIARADHVIE